MTTGAKAQDQWRCAQEREGQYWQRRAADPIGLIHDLNHAYPLAQLIRSALPLNQARRILEIGVGGLGVGLLWMFSETERKVGVDPILPKEPRTGSRAMDAFVRQSREGVEYYASDSTPLPFNDEEFDLAICCNVLDHTIAVQNSRADFHLLTAA